MAAPQSEPRDAASSTSPSGSVMGVGRRLSPLDAAFLYFERPNQLLHVGCVAEIDGTVSFSALVDTIGERLCARLPRYRERPVRATLDLDRPAWEPDPAFEVRRHVRHVALPAPAGDAELRELVDALFMAPLDGRHPLWEVVLIDGLARGGSALFCKMHHCMADGVSGAQILDLLTDPADGAPASGSCPLPANAPERAEDPRAGLASWLGLPTPADVVGRAREAGEALATIVGLLREPSDRLPFNQPLGDRRCSAWTTLPLEEVLTVRGRAGCKVNDVLLAVIAGALRRYLEARGVATDELRVRTIVPVSVRRSHERLQLGNLVSAMLPRLPVNVADPVARLHVVAKEMQELKLRGQPRAAGLLLSVLGALPAPVEALLGRLAPEGLVANTICTNVPGPREVRYLLGRRVGALHGLVPLFQSMGVEFAILSYAGTVSISATADPSLVPDVQELASALRASSDELVAAFRSEADADERRPRPSSQPPRVADLMAREVISIRTSDSLLLAHRVMRARRIRHLPVLDAAGRLVGIVTHRDLLAASSSSLDRETIEARVHVLAGSEASEVMETHLCVAGPDEAAAEAGARMIGHKIGCLPVLDEAGRLVGIVTEEDFVRWATERMEVVGSRERQRCAAG
jgi:diacylglycerol O-acyltransferase